MSCTEAVVLFHFEKRQDDELTLEVGDVITDVKQVCVQSVNHISFKTTCTIHVCIVATCWIYVLEITLLEVINQLSQPLLPPPFQCVLFKFKDLVLSNIQRLVLLHTT